VQPVVELPGVDRELQPPGCEQDRGDDESGKQSRDRDPAERVQPPRVNRGGAEGGGDERVGGQQCAGSLADAGDDRLLVS
jgi:hypothetical protein